MKVAIFSTCVIDLMFPNVGQAMVEVLERLGCETYVPDNSICCGQPTYNSGYDKDSRKVFVNTIKAFEEADYVVGPSGSCIGMLTEYKDIMKDDPEYAEQAAALSDKVYEFTQFIYRVLGVADVGATLPAKATYHRSCHMTRILGERESPYELLDEVKGLEMIELPHAENCCGFGGTFSVKMPEISKLMVSEKASDILSTGAEILIAAEMGCLMNIGGKLNRDGKKIKIMHIAEVLNTDVDESRIQMPAMTANK